MQSRPLQFWARLGLLLACAAFLLPLTSAGPVTSSADTPLAGKTGAKRQTAIKKVPLTAQIIANVPAYDYSYGAAPTSGAMLAAYYDNNGYPNIYSGPTNGGVAPLTNADWGVGECPLSATHIGIDGRTSNGHVEDYWVAPNSVALDPYFTGSWTPHTDDCIADFTRSNESAFGRKDGHYEAYGTADGSKAYDDTLATYPDDFCHGLRMFFASRGYAMRENYEQVTDVNRPAFFSFNDYKAEIDAGYPVLIYFYESGGLINTVLGIGYEPTADGTCYILDTSDHAIHTMTWNAGYDSNEQFGVGVIHLAPLPVVSVPGVQQASPVTPVAFGSTTGNAITVPDVDYGDNTLTVKLTASLGALTMDTSGVTVLSGATGTNTLECSGTAAALNTALETLVFQPFASIQQLALLQVTATITGYPASTSTATVPIEAYFTRGNVTTWDYSTFAAKKVVTKYGTFSSKKIPNTPSALANKVMAVSAGVDHALALLNDQTVAAWGSNYYGQCAVPKDLVNVIAVSAGAWYSMALKADGTVVCWGDDTAGVLEVPAGLTNVVAISAGWEFASALKSDGTVVCWGTNGYGLLDVPVGLDQVIAISATNSFHVMALRADGTVVSWGGDLYGEISAQPALTNVVAIAAGYDFSFALTSDGLVSAWGDDNANQVSGAAGLTNIVAISAGHNQGFALDGDGDLWFWGDNAPLELTGLNNVRAFASGDGFDLTASYLLTPLVGNALAKNVTAYGATLFATLFDPGQAPAFGYAFEWRTTLPFPLDGKNTLRKNGAIPGNGKYPFTFSLAIPTGLLSNTRYYFIGECGNLFGLGYTNPAQFVTLPADPFALRATNVSATGFTAAWNPVAGTEPVTYFLEVSQDPKFTTTARQYKNLPGVSSGVTGLSASIPVYYFRVRAMNSTGFGAYSNVVTVALWNSVNIAVTPIAGGSVRQGRSVRVKYGDSLVITAAPTNATWSVNYWTVDNVIVQRGGTTLTLKDVKDRHDVVVVFAKR